MPYKLSKDGLSVLDEQGKVIKKHPTKAKAKAHLMALNMNVKEGVTEAGARNNAADLKRIQSMHDMACELGAECQGDKPTMEGRQQEATSYDFIREKVRDAIGKVLPVPSDGWMYIEEMFDEYAVVEIGPPRNYWKVPYTLNGEAVALASQASWEKVIPQRTWMNAQEARRQNKQRKLEALKRWANANTSKQK